MEYTPAASKFKNFTKVNSGTTFVLYRNQCGLTQKPLYVPPMIVSYNNDMHLLSKPPIQQSPTAASCFPSHQHLSNTPSTDSTNKNSDTHTEFFKGWCSLRSFASPHEARQHQSAQFSTCTRYLDLSLSIFMRSALATCRG